MLARVRTRWFVGLGLLVVAPALGGIAGAQQDDRQKRAILEKMDSLRAELPDVFFATEPGEPLMLPGVPLTPETHGIGVAVQPVDATMRDQLELPEEQGVVVTEVAPDSPAAKAGLKPHDILLKLGDDPVNAPGDLDHRFRDGIEEPVAVQFLRGGKATTVQVTPRKPAEARAYFIGVSVNPLSDALRSQLDLPEDQGVVAGDVLPESPAAKAGIQPNDILLTIDGKAVGDIQGLVERIQELKDKTVPVKFLRGGEEKTVEVTPEKRKEPLPDPVSERPRVPRVLQPFVPGLRPGWPAPSVWVMGPDGTVRLVPPGQVPMRPGGPGMPPRPLERRLEEMNNQIQELRKAVEELQKASKKE